MLLEMRGICKSFPGVRALDNAHLELASGSVHALMGENGAGKSTLMKCLFGVYQRDSGEVLLEGETVDFRSAADALGRGVAMVHQELNQALTMTVMDNLWLGRFPKIVNWLPFISHKKMKEMTEELFASLGLKIRAEEQMSRLSVASRQMVEIAKAVSYGARVIAFDEPTSSLTDKEIELLFTIINRLKADGVGIIYISHKMAEILQICDTVTVMRDGRHIATLPSQELSTDKIIQLMVGREMKDRYPKRNTPPTLPLLEVNDLEGESGIPRRVSLTLRRGEVMGIAG
ncbi:MAG: sugar ABC transporter ATP-binding protein, partial [Clostridia bacterium]|nr:sugar ABC transporter ATP-binding protein [Clostridia bacterium]